MESLLEKLGIDKTLSDEEILAALERKQMEYLERLDSATDDDRKAELKSDLDLIENSINTLSWSIKRKSSGIAKDETETGIEPVEEEYVTIDGEKIRTDDYRRIDQLMRQKQGPLPKPETTDKKIGRFFRNLFMCTMIAVEAGIFVVPIIALITGKAIIGIVIVLAVDIIASIVMTKDEVDIPL